MPRFEYLARDLSGEETTGIEFAATADDVVDGLHRRGLIVLSVDASEAGTINPLARLKQMPGLLPGLNVVGVRTLALFTRQLATMVTAGLPLVRGLQSLARDEKNKEMKRVLDQVSDDLHGGLSFSESLAKHPHVFNGLYIAMVKSGERSGTLDRVLDQLGEYLEKADALQTKVKAAMAYPVFVFVFSLCAASFLLLKVIPTFEKIYAEFHAALPAPTVIVLHISAWLRHNFLLGALLVAAGIIAFQFYRRTERGAYTVDALILKTPVFGSLALKAAAARCTRTLGALLASGLPMLEALDLVTTTAGNRVVAEAVRQTREDVAAGSDLAAAFARTEVMPHMVLQLMATGQETGALDTMLTRAANFCDQQVDAGVAALSSLLEPVMIIMMGGLVGVLVVTMFLPVFNLGKAIGG